MIAAERVLAGTSSGAAEKPNHARLHLVPVLAVALLLRVFIALLMLERGPNLWFYHQASELGCLAQSVVDGHGLASPFCGSTGPSALLAPGYPLLVAFAFHLFGGETTAATVMIIGLQIVFGVLTVLSTMLVARRISDARIANVTGIICAVSPAFVRLPVLFWETSFTTLSLITAVAFSLRCIDHPKRLNWIALGILCGFCMLINPALLLTLAGVLAVTIYRTPQLLRRNSVAAVLAWALIFAIWPIRNGFVFHAFVPLRTNLGYEFWQGNRPGSDGEFSAELHPNTNRLEHLRYVQLGEIAYMHEKSVLALSAVQAAPARFLKLSLKRTFRFWTSFMPNNSSVLIMLNLCITSLFGFSGLYFLMRKSLGDALMLAAPLLIFPLPYYITHADFRFRLVLDPLAIMLSVYALQSLYCLYRERHLPALTEVAPQDVIHDSTVLSLT